MANQTAQLSRLLADALIKVPVVRTNAPYAPAAIARVRFVRAFFRLIPYLVDLWRSIGKAQVVHVMANSGWSWHLYAVPAILIARLRRRRAIVNFRGGAADTFLQRQVLLVKPLIRLSHALVVPSSFLESVFSSYGIQSRVIANGVDFSRFHPGHAGRNRKRLRIVVARNLEPIYAVHTAIAAFALIKGAEPNAELFIAGEGSERKSLERLVADAGLAKSVTFLGRLSPDQIARLYRSADVLLNTSVVDNMPNSLLEAMASKLAIVSSDSGGIPHMLTDRVNALLVPADHVAGFAEAVLELSRDDALRGQLTESAYLGVQRCSWDAVQSEWLSLYRGLSDRTQARGAGA